MPVEVMLDGLHGCACYTLAADGTITSWNAAAERMHGFTAADVVGHPVDMLELREPGESAADVLTAATRDGRVHDEGLRVRADASTFWANVAVTALRDDEGGHLGFIVITQDLTEQLAATERWRTAHARSAALLAHWRGAAAVVGPDGSVTYATEALAVMVDRTVAAITGAPLTALVRPTDAARLADALASLDTARQRTTVEVRLQGDGEHFVDVELELTNRRDDVDIAGVVVNAYDVSERAEQASKLIWQMQHDDLTGLANRSFLLERLAHPRPGDADLTFGALLLVDIDHFATINDTIGHNASDRVLVELASRIKQVVRLGDEVVRGDGDRFAVLIEEPVSAIDATALADRIRRVVSDPITGIDGLSALTVSVGVALGTDNHRTELLPAAETALKLAKERGRDRTEVFEPSLRADAHRRVETEHSLRHAIDADADADALIVHYQPVLDLATERVVGAEALLRIRDADGRAHLPTHIIAVAEDTGLIVPIGAMVIEQACRQLKDWRRELGPLAPEKVAVNVAPGQWASPGLTATVEQSLREHGIEPGALCLEITESSQIATDEVVTSNMRALRALGVQLALDDFGAGHAALNYLTRFEADCVKIDKGFVDDIVTNRSQEIIVRGVVDMATSLGMVVIAEGVEETDQRDALRRLGCHQGQGWLWHKAVSGAEFTEYVRSLAAPADSAEHDGTAGAA